VNRDKYIHNVLQLKKVAHPGPTTLARAIPHIADVDHVFALLRTGESIALPPVLVEGAFWRFQLNGGLASCRTLGSFVPEAVKNDNLSSAYPFVNEAIAYAGQHWPASLIRDTSMASAWFDLQDPSQPNEAAGGATTILSIGALLTAPTEVAYKTERPARVFDDLIIRASAHPLERHELRHRTAAIIRICALCAHWLERDRCPGCERTFPYEGSVGFGMLPLPEKAIAAAEAAGHEFESDPRRWL
jgi:hypothetical protein